MKIIYMGTPGLCLPVLEGLQASGHHVALAVSQPDRPRGRGKKPAQPPVKCRADELGIPCIQPDSLKSQTFHTKIAEQKADILVVVAFSLLPESLFSLVKHGAVNLHASLLPKYRGAAPISWAIVNGEKETGVTIFQLDAGMDRGHVLGQTVTPIGPNETAGELGGRLMILGRDLLLDLLDKMEAGTLQLQAQDHRLATPAPKLRKSDGRVDWTLTARQIHDRVRGFNPYPICHTCLPDMGGKTLRIFRSEVLDKASSGPGRVLISPDGYPLAGCGDRTLKLLEVQLEGKARTSGNQFLNGVQDHAGLFFE